MASRYCYPNSDVLINKLNLREQKDLDRAERKLVTIRLAELYIRPITGEFDLPHLQAIHRYIFQDLYPFAGELREEPIAKGNFQFANHLYLQENARKLYYHLQEDRFLKGLKKNAMARKLAYYMAEINVIHPFREGNGRALREFMRCLAMASGYTIDWTQMKKDELLNAIKLSVIDTKMLEQMIYYSLVEEEPSREVMNQWKKAESEREKRDVR